MISAIEFAVELHFVVHFLHVITNKDPYSNVLLNTIDTIPPVCPCASTGHCFFLFFFFGFFQYSITNALLKCCAMVTVEVGVRACVGRPFYWNFEAFKCATFSLILKRCKDMNI